MFLDKVIFDLSAGFWSYCGLQIVLYIVFGALMVLLSVVLNNTTASMAIGIAAAGGVMFLLYQFIDYVAGKIGVEGLAVSKYVPTGNIQTLTIGGDSQKLLRSLLVGVFFTIFATIFGMIVMKKRDVA